MCATAGLESSVRPEDIARALLDQQWQTVLYRIRQTATKQAVAGDIVILRKGEVADPEEFKGLIKLQITAQGQARIARVQAEKQKALAAASQPPAQE